MEKNPGGNCGSDTAKQTFTRYNCSYSKNNEFVENWRNAWTVWIKLKRMKRKIL